MGVEVLILSFDYKPDLVRGYEDASRVQLLAYLTKDLGHAYEIRRPGHDEHRFHLNIKIPEGQDLNEPFIDADAGVVIRAFAAGVNDDNQKVMRQVGGTMFRLSELLSSSGRRTVEHRPMIVPNLEDPVSNTVPCKGSISLVAEPLPQLIHSVKPRSQHDYVPENYEQYAQILIQYQQMVRLPYTELQPTFRNATGLCMPIVSSGIAKLPGALFAYPRSEPSTPEWHTNAFLAATRRAYPFLESKQQVIEFLGDRKLSDTELMNIVMLSHTAVVANGTCYVGDGVYLHKNKPALGITKHAMPGVGFQKLLEAFPPSKLAKRALNSRDFRADSRPIGALGFDTSVEFHGMEDFAVGMCRMMKDIENWGCLGAIDCEDGGMDAMIQAMDLSYCNFEGNPTMQRVQQAQKNYSPTLSLEYVNGRELSDSERNNPLGGHMKSLYMTRDYEVDMQERGSSARPVFEGVDRRIGEVPSDYRTVPVIDGEGTGLMMPVPNDTQADQMQANHQYLQIFTEATASSMRGVRFMMPHHKSRPSRFYNTINSYVPLELADQGFPAIEHLATKSTPRAGTTIGIDYLEFINGSTTNSAFVNGRMTDEQVPYMQHLLKFLPPVPAYESAPDRLESHPLFERLVKMSREQGRVRKPNTESEYYQVYFREHQVNESAVQVLMSRVGTKQRIYKVTYFHENFGKGVSSWCVQFHLNP